MYHIYMRILKLIWNLLALFGLITIIGLVVGFWWLNKEFPGLLPFSGVQVQETGDNPLLDTQQEKTLQAVGVNPAALPSEMTPEMEACFVEKLGQSRVDAIKAGDKATVTDYFEARGCL